MSLKSFGQSFCSLTVLVAGCGYLVDMFDFLLFNMLRVSSLTNMGLTGDALTQSGLLIMNCQLAGLIIGAYFWGVMGDKFGRKNTLFGSIILYSIAVFTTGFVQTPDLYAALRFISGLGLAGELGGGLALIAEKFSDQRRGYGIGVFIIMGFAGVVLASICANFLPWRTCYFIGGGAGLLILIARMLVKESALFVEMAHEKIKRGGLARILSNRRLAVLFISSIFLMLPTVFIPHFLWTLSPEIAKNMGLTEAIKPQIVLGVGYGCVILGDLAALWLAERLQSRKKAIGVFALLGVTSFIALIWLPATGTLQFYILNACLALAFGIWVVSATVITEQFGTNHRATVATTIPNFARGSVIFMNLALIPLKSFGLIPAITVIGAVVFILSIAGWFVVRETYGKDLHYYD